MLKKFAIVAVVCSISAAALWADAIPIGYVSWDVTFPGNAGQFDVVNQTGPNASIFPDTTFPVTTTVALSNLSLLVDFSDGSATTYGSPYFTQNADGISFDGSPIPIGGNNAQPTEAILTGSFSPLTITLNDGSTDTILDSFTATILPSSPPTLADGDLAVIFATTATSGGGSTVREPGFLMSLALGILGLYFFRHAARPTRAHWLRLFVLALAVAASQYGRATAQIHLNTWTAPSSGVAGANNVNVTATNFPAGSINPANVNVTFYSNACGGAVAAQTTGNSITTILGTTRRVNVSLPAILPTGTYFIGMQDTADGAASFTGANCSQVQVTSSVGAAAKLVFSTEPANGTAGSPLEQVAVQVQDNNGNAVTSSSASITINSTAAGVGGTTTVAAVNGVATFSNLVFAATGSYTLTAASSGITSATSTPFTISAGAAAKLVFGAEPANGTAGSPLSGVVVQVQDANGNVVTGSTPAISINSTTAGVGGTTTVAAVNGAATFSNLVFTTTGTYTLTAASSGIASATSTPFTISAGTAAKLVFSSEPANGTALSPLASVVVQVQDANGNVVTGSSPSITISSTAAGVGGTTTAVAVNGAATFSNLFFTTAGSYTLTAASAGLAGTTSTPFTISAASNISLVFTTQPPIQVQTGQLLLPGPQATLEDASGAVLTGYNGPVTISIGNNPSRATISGTLTQNAVGGVATFPDLSVNTAGNGFTLVASAPGLSATSAPFSVRVSSKIAACLPSSSLGVLLPPSGTGSVTAYVANGSWSDGHMGIQVVPIEGGGSPSVISTPNTVNSCASNSVTGETVCVANNADVYLISGSTLNNTLTSSSSGVTYQMAQLTVGSTPRPPKSPILSGGWCMNCGVAINGVTNTAVIEMGITTGLPPFYSALQFLDLGANTFSAPFLLANDLSEDIQWDPIHNLILSPSEYQFGDVGPEGPNFLGLAGGNYDLIDTSSSNPAEFGRLLPSANLDAAAEDCNTGIAVSGLEGDVPPPFQFPAIRGLFISDLTQATFTPGSPGNWTAPRQFVAFPEFYDLGYIGGGTPAVAVPPGSHLAVVTGDEGGDQLGVVELPSASGSGTPGFGDYAAAELPRTPDGQSWSQGFDPHPITAYVSPNTGRPMAIFANSAPPTWLAVIDLQGLLDAPRVAGVFPGGLGGPCPGCTHTVDPSYDLVANNVVRYVATAPAIAQICPTTGQRGQQHQLVSLRGNHTHWTQGTTTVSFGPGITVESFSVSDLTDATAVISIDPATALGPRTVVTTTGSEVATVDNPYEVTSLASVGPSTGQQGQQNLAVTLTGEFTSWVGGVPRGSITQVDFGAGIIVTSVTVNSPTSLTAVLNIDPSAPTGPRPISISNPITGCDTQVFNSGFTVTAGALILESVTPNAGQSGQQNLSVVLTGSGTNWVQGTTTADFGPSIAVTSLTVNSPTSATAVLNINANTPVGAQTVTITTGSEVETRVNGFAVTSTVNPLMQILPNTSQQGQQNLSVLIADNFGSYWVPGLTVADFGPGITVTSLTVNGQYSATAVLNISPSAGAGPRTVTITTGSEIDTMANGFTVTSSAGTPVLTQISPNTGQQGQQNLPVTITGNLTHFSSSSVVTFGGTGITAGTPTAATATSLTAPVSIAANAPLGAQSVQVVTGNETVSLSGAFTLLAGTPVITQVNPVSGAQGQSNILLTITGSFTHFSSSSIVTFSGTGVTAGAPVTATATSLTVLVTVAANAPLGQQGIQVATGSEVASLANAFSVTAAPGSISLSLGQSVVTAGASDSYTATALDASGNPVALTPNCQVTGDPISATGTAPTVTTTAVTTATDTRGVYTLTCSLSNPPENAGASFTVLAPAVANTTTQEGTFASFSAAIATSSSLLSQIQTALNAGNQSSANAALAQLQTTLNGVNFDALRRAAAFSPEGGFPARVSQLPNFGINPTPQDANVGPYLANLSNAVTSLTTFLQTPLSTLTSAQLATYAQLISNLSAQVSLLPNLNPSAFGIVANEDQIDLFLGQTLPQLYQAITQATIQYLTNAGFTASLAPGIRNRVLADSRLQLRNAAGPRSSPVFSPLVRRKAGLAFQLLGLLTIELESELTVDLIKKVYGPFFNYLAQASATLLVHSAFQTFVSNLQLDGVITGGSLSVNIFYAAPSFIEGEDFNALAANNDVYLVGPDQVALVVNFLKGLQAPTNLSALFSDFQGLVDLLQSVPSLYQEAKQPPDGTSPTCILGNSPPCLQLVYNNGFNSVYTNSNFAIPAPVMVIVRNIPTGVYSSGVFDFVPANPPQ